ncbi:MAG: NUDIX domain-containing protein [Chloroflexota bacterium]|nr:NUDIX domain-containing protein [Chloroflexota bacterium]
MTKTIYGDRIGKTGKLRTGCSATIFDSLREKVLLTRRTDNNRWCLPGGGIDPGESVTEACIREVWEETGLRVQVRKLVGVYSSPNEVLEYPDGNRYHTIALNFDVEVVGGELTTSAETSEIAYFSIKELDEVDLMNRHRIRIADALENKAAPFIR